MNKQLVIFDLDGTLLDTIGDIAYSANRVLENHCYQQHPLEAYKTMVGNGILMLMKRAMPQTLSHSESLALELKNEFADIYANHLTQYTKPYDGIIELLESLQQHNVKIAVASNKYHAATTQIIAHYFPTINFYDVRGHEEGKPTKPDPYIVNSIIGNSISKSDVLYVGDSDVDMLTAANAQVEAAGVSWGFRSRTELASHNPAYIVDKATDILEICK